MDEWENHSGIDKHALMKVVSVNIGKKKLVNWKGKQEYTGIYKSPVNKPIILGKEDVENDDVVDRKYHGGIFMACYIYSADHYPYWKEKYPREDWDYGMFGENITIEGLDEKKLHLGDVYKIGSAIVKISQPRKPCYKLGIRFDTQAILKDYIQADYPGSYLQVIESGTVQNGDEFTLIEKHPDAIGLLEAYHLQYSSTDQDVERIKEILSSDVITPDVRSGLLKRID